MNCLRIGLLGLGIALALNANAKSEMGKKQNRKPAQAVQCPPAGQDGALEKTVQMINDAPNCDQADQIASQCGWGSSADTQIAGAAGNKCATVFKGKMTADDKAIYLKLISKCQKKYAGRQGTIYISLESYCEEEIGKMFAHLYTPADDEG
jgi:hypothetical protein